MYETVHLILSWFGCGIVSGIALSMWIDASAEKRAKNAHSDWEAGFDAKLKEIRAVLDRAGVE